MTILLSFQDVAVARGDRTLLRALQGEVKAGEALHVRGANGVGKTSLLEVLSGLREPAQGAVRAPPTENCHWIGHRNALSPALTPAENLRFWCALQGAPAGGVERALQAFALKPVASRPCRQLSAGQKRRAALARLAVQHRPFWFLDEPLSGLDAVGVEHWTDLLRAHLQQGGAAVITSHQALPGTVAGLRMLDLE